MVDENSHNLTPRQVRAISVILSSRTIVEAARRLHVSRETLHAWLRDPVFREAYDTQSKEVVALAIASLKLTMSKSVDVLNRLLDNRSPTIRFKAACKIYDSNRLEQIDDRLTELEQYVLTNDKLNERR